MENFTFNCSNINDHVIYSNNPREYYVSPFAQICDSENPPFQPLYKCQWLDKCNICDDQSISKNLCLECNKLKRYYFLNNNELSKSKINELFMQYIDCVNEITKPKNYYFNEENQDYEPCFLTCGACNYGGNQIENNCTLCGQNFMNQPDVINSTNCVIKCKYLYYYTYYGEYKCTEVLQCPKEYSIFIPEKEKCINDCSKDDSYLYQYNGECVNECPNNTINESFICKDRDTDNNKCIIVEKDLLPIEEELIQYQSEILARNYAKEFAYTNNHVSIYTNNIHSIIIYKNDECIKELSIEIVKIDFIECKKKLKNNFIIDNNLIIVIITKLIKNLNYKKVIYYSIFNPNNSEKLITKNLCENESLLIEENLRIKLEKSNYDIDSLLYLARQNINIFNLSHPFYKDICFPFENILEKDIVLKDRILLYYPHITLCENNCKILGIDAASLRSKCVCKSNFIDNIFNEDNNFLSKSIEIQELKEIIRQTNIEIVRCYKNIFLLSNIRTCVGGLIIIVLIIGQIISAIIFFGKNNYLIRKYIFGITNKYISFLRNENIKNEPINVNNQLIDINRRQPNKRVTNKNDEKITIKIKRKKKKSKTRYSMKEDKKSRNLKLLNDNQNNSSVNNKIINNNNNNVSDKILKIDNDCKVNIYDSNLINSKDMLNISNSQKDNPKFLIESKDMKEYLSTEIDDMDYEDAMKRDKRKFCEYFCEKLKINQILLSTFYAIDPLKPRAIKLLLFILDIDLYLFINALFFNEEYISDLFHSTKEDNFINFIIRSYNRFFYTTLVGVIINYIIECFFVNEKKIKGAFKREKDNIILLKNEITRIIKKIVLRNTFFIIFSFVMSIFSLYYILCFNSVYPHVRNEWIKSSIIIIIVMQLLYLLECLFETIFRFISFKYKNERFYRISLLLS